MARPRRTASSLRNTIIGTAITTATTDAIIAGGAGAAIADDVGGTATIATGGV